MNTDEIRARAEAATPGPWVNRPEKSFNVQSSNKNIASCFRTENADFIAYAREDIPALLDALEAKERELAEYRTAEEQGLLVRLLPIDKRVFIVEDGEIFEFRVS